MMLKDAKLYRRLSLIKVLHVSVVTTVNVGYNDCTCHHSIGPYIQMSLIGNNDIWHSECHYKQMCLSMQQNIVISRENRCSWLFLVLLCLYTYSLLSRQSYKPLPTMAPMQH